MHNKQVVAVVLHVAQGLWHVSQTLFKSYSPEGHEATQVPFDKKALLEEVLHDVQVDKSVSHVKHGVKQAFV